MNKKNIELFENFVDVIMKVYNVQGITILGFDASQITYEYTKGYRDVENKLPIEDDTVFGIASISKSFTVLAILQLAQRGIIDLDAPINTYFKEINLPENQMPSVRNLLSHAGGFLPQERFLMKDVAKKLGIEEGTELSNHTGLADKGLEMLIERINNMKAFTGTPGQRHSYSNFSFGLLTAIVANYGGEKCFEDYMLKNVIKPLGLEKTFYAFNQTQKENNITKLYENVLGHLNTTMDYEDMGFVLLGGGAVKATRRDLVKYARFYLGDGTVDGHTIISKEYLEAMGKSYVSYKTSEGYGYGLVAGKIDDVPYMGHSGGLTGVSSYFAVSRETQKGIVVLCNTSNIPSSAIGIAALKLIHGQVPDYQQPIPECIPFSNEVLREYVGTYKSEEGANFSIVNKEDRLYWQSGDELFETELLADGALLVTQKLIKSYAPVLKDESGRVWAIYSGSRIIPKVPVTKA